jgi:MSHA biogenesis protein MshN
MSLVNKMLQELDRRHAARPSDNGPDALFRKSVRAVHQPAVGSEWFWWALAVLMVVAIAWIAWVGWQLMPRSAVTDLALQTSRPRAISQAPVPPQAASALPAPVTAAAPAPPVVSQEAPGPQASTQAAVLAPAPAARPDMLTLATEINTAIRSRPVEVAAEPRKSATPPPAIPSRAQEAVPPRIAALAPPNAPLPPQLKVPSPAQPRASQGFGPPSVQIDKRDITPRERSEVEFRRAVGFVNQGRVAEGMDSFRAALSLDPSHEVARQTQVALLIDGKRIDEAADSLKQGLQLNPANVSFAIALARIMVEHNDIAGALSLLQQHAPAPSTNADYHAFVAALYQRLGHHKEATQSYQAAVRIAPQTAAWWVGLGISLDAQQRRTEAAEAFRRAKAGGSLSPELAGFVDQRIRAAR